MKILMCEYMDYDTVFQVGSHYYAKEFANDSNHITWSPQPTSFLSKKSNHKINENLKIHYPRVSLPFCRLPLLNSKLWARYYLECAPKSIHQELKNEQYDVLWMTNVKMYHSTEKLKHRYLVHRMADDFSGFSGAYRNLLYLQTELIKKSNVVIVTAKNLVDQARSYNKNVLYLPNGVDTERFKNTNDEIPEEYKLVMDMPKVVYVGALDDWFDYGLIQYAVKKMKHMAFIIIGGTNEKIQSIASENANLLLLGKKAHSDIPKYLKAADVGIMPFTNNKLTNSIHPLKLYEYFAAGLPAVSAKLNEVEEMNSPAWLYETKEEFVDLIKQAVNETHDKEKYRTYAEGNTWSKRFLTVKEYIHEDIIN